MSAIYYAMETAAEAERKYFAGDPYVSNYNHMFNGYVITPSRKQLEESGPCDEVVQWKDLQQASQVIALTVRRTFATEQARGEWESEFDTHVHWSGTAVKLVQKADDANKFIVYKATNAVLLLTNLTPLGISIDLSYSLRIGKWVREETEETLLSPMGDESGGIMGDESGGIMASES